MPFDTKELNQQAKESRDATLRDLGVVLVKVVDLVFRHDLVTVHVREQSEHRRASLAPAFDCRELEDAGRVRHDLDRTIQRFLRTSKIVLQNAILLVNFALVA